MSDKPHKHEKWEKFKGAMKKAGKWTVKNLLPVAVSMVSGGLGLPVALGGLASELFKKFSDANLKIPISEEKFKEKLEELCNGEGKVIEYIQDKLEESNKKMEPKDIELTVKYVMTPLVSEMNSMLEIMREEKADVQEILAGWLEDQTQLIQDQSEMVQNEFFITHEQLNAIETEMLNGFQKMDFKQSQILENINNLQSKMQFELVNIKKEVSELIQSVFGQSILTAFDLDTMFNLATVHFNQQNLASKFDLAYNPDLYVRPESFFGSMTKYLSDFKNPMKKNVPIFLLLAHLGMGKTWNFAYITEYLLIGRNIAIPFFINLKDGLQQQLYGIFKTYKMADIADRCQKIKTQTQLPIFLILDGLDELTTSDLKDVLLMLKELLNKRSDALCVALSCRIIAWVEDQQILNERSFFEDQVWANQNSPDWQSQFDIATPISCVLGEFSDIELNFAISCYGLERDKFSEGLYEICHQPYILRLVSEFVALNKVYPRPEDPESMESLFYSDDLESQKNTILYRMGIHGNILYLFSRIINAFPSAKSEMSDDDFQEFVDDQYFRPILYSGIISKVWRQMTSVYEINPVYAPLLTLLFPHLSNPEHDEKGSRKQKVPTKPIQPTPVVQLTLADEFQYLLRLANKKRDEKDFDGELETLKNAKKIVDKAFDFEMTIEYEKRMAQFEEDERNRGEAGLKTKEAERKAMEEEKRKAMEEEDKNKIVNFRYTELIKREMDVILEIEEKTGELPIVSEFKFDTFGIMVRNYHVVFLGIYNRRLRKLPNSIGELTELTNINLTQNTLSDLPESFGLLTKLKGISLDYNSFKFLPNAIVKLTELVILEIGNNSIKSLPDTIGQLTELRRLEINMNSLTALPDSIGQLKHLEILNLMNNELEKLPETIGQLTALKELNLFENKLTTLPNSIGKMTALKELDLKNNKLTTLPDSICELTMLENLMLDTNQLNELPKTIGQLTTLDFITLKQNQLTKIPDSIGKLANATILYLSENQLTELPKSINGMKKLKKLGLEENKLTTLPDSIGELTELIYLDLYKNQLKKIPDSIGKLTKLMKLNLGNNQLTKIPDSIGKLKELEKLSFKENQLTAIPKTIGELKKLEVLLLDNNKLTSLPDSIGQLKKLQHLDLFDNQLTKLPNTIGNLAKLKKLELDENKLTTLPESIAQLKKLRMLNIGDNPIKSIPKPVEEAIKEIKSRGNVSDYDFSYDDDDDDDDNDDNDED